MLVYILFVVGLVLLVKGANWLVDGASSLSRRLGVSPLIVGLTVVAFGTSLPELVVNLISSINGTSDIAFGNIVGSNISNILLIIGSAALVRSLVVHRTTTWKEIPISLLAALVLFAFALGPFIDGQPGIISRVDGMILLLFFCVFLYYVFEMVRDSRPSKSSVKSKKTAKEFGIHTHTKWQIAFLLFGGLIALVVGGKWVVDGAVVLARLFGMSEYFISLTILAVGTSLPELVTSIVAAVKGKAEIAVGNVVGSNIFNVFFILGLSAVIRPILLPATAIVDLIVLVGATLLLFSAAFIGKKEVVDRWLGAVLLGSYAVYVVFLVVRG